MAVSRPKFETFEERSGQIIEVDILGTITVASVLPSILRMQYSDCAKAHAWVLNSCPRHQGQHDDSPRGEHYYDSAA